MGCRLILLKIQFFGTLMRSQPTQLEARCHRLLASVVLTVLTGLKSCSIQLGACGQAFTVAQYLDCTGTHPSATPDGLRQTQTVEQGTDDAD